MLDGLVRSSIEQGNPESRTTYLKQERNSTTLFLPDSWAYFFTCYLCRTSKVLICELAMGEKPQKWGRHPICTRKYVFALIRNRLTLQRN